MPTMRPRLPRPRGQRTLHVFSAGASQLWCASSARRADPMSAATAASNLSMRPSRPMLACLAALFAALGGCGNSAPGALDPGTPPPSAPPGALVTAAPPDLASVLVPGVPHVLQKPDFCGEAAA